LLTSRLEEMPEIEREEILAARLEERQQVETSNQLDAMYRLTGAKDADAGASSEEEGRARRKRPLQLPLTVRKDLFCVEANARSD
jgi:hypothetical protein